MLFPLNDFYSNYLKILFQVIAKIIKFNVHFDKYNNKNTIISFNYF